MNKKLKLGVGTGNFWKKDSYDINKAIKEISLFNVNFIEITFGDLELFENLTLTKESLELLKKFEFVTIHAPCVSYEKENAKRILQMLKELHDLIKAKYVTFHPHYFTDFDLLLKYDWNVCIENSRYGKVWNLKKLKKLFKKHPSFGFVLDTCHAGTFSCKEIELLFNEFKNRIKYFHLSAFYKEIEHQPLYTIDKEYLSQFEKIISFGKPLILELWGTKTSLEEIKKEIKFLRKQFA